MKTNKKISGIIYLIINLVTGQPWVGLTTKTLEERWKQHITRITCTRKRTYLYNAMKKYGIDNFIIQPIDYSDNIEDLNKKEDYWATYYNSYYPNGYNLQKCGGNLGAVKHETTILKMSKTYKFIDPNGKLHEITNLKKFCKENNLDHCHMYKLAQGKRSNHKEWKNSEIPVDYVILLSPNKEKFKVELFHGNLTKFCNKHGIYDISGMYMLIYDYPVQSYKDWTVIEKFIK